MSGRRNRSRNITWFNPPFSLNVKTNVGASFLRIVQECFPSNHKLHKICNKNTIKVSYRTMKNMKSILSIHNKKVLRKHHEQLHPSTAVAPHCNCQARFRKECPMPGQCCITDVVYRAPHPSTSPRTAGQQQQQTATTNIHRMLSKFQKKIWEA